MRTGTAFQMRVRDILEGTDRLTDEELEMVKKPFILMNEDIEETPEGTFGFHFGTN